MPIMRKFFLAFFALLLFSRIIFSHAEVVDKIIVIVNDEIITQGELDQILSPIYEQYKNVYTDQELARKIGEARQGVLQRLIQDKLLLTEAKRRGIEVEDKEVKARIDELRKRFSTEQEFNEALERENILLAELKRKHRERIMIDKLIDMEIGRRVSVSPNEALDFYENHKEGLKEPAKIRLRAILIKITERCPEEEASRLANEILGRLQEGGDFALLAKKYSDGPYADSGGDMGWVREGDLMDRINDLVFRLEAGQISGILKTNLGLHIFKVEDKILAGPSEFQEVKGRIEQILFNKKIEQELGKWLADLRKDAYIAFR